MDKNHSPTPGSPLTPVVLVRVFYGVFKGLFIGVFDHQERVEKTKKEVAETFRRTHGEEAREVFIDEEEMRRSYSKCRVLCLLTIFWGLLLPGALTTRLLLSRWWLGTSRTAADISVWEVLFALVPFYFLVMVGLAINGWLDIPISRLLGFVEVDDSSSEKQPPSGPGMLTGMNGEKLIDKPSGRRSRRVYVLWGVALLLALFVVGIVLSAFGGRVVRVRSAIREVAYGRLKPGEAIQQLGGPQKASRDLALFVRLPWAAAYNSDRSSVRVCSHPDEGIAWSLLGLCKGTAVPYLIRELSASRPGSRGAAAWQLCGIGPEAQAAVPALEKALHDEDENVRAAAAEALKKIAPRRPYAGSR